ncbi:hypothetical protein [Paenibacillus sp. FSL R5-0519]|uniref:hypothetical protein n=1 Tax=Paenibacillus sp. FSL R5-0519 TaxID=2921648 RepID=UPI0030DD0D3C
MVTVHATLQEANGNIAETSGNVFELDEAQVTALLNSDIVTYPRDGGNGWRTSVKTRIIEKHFSLFDKNQPSWQIVFKVIE